MRRNILLAGTAVFVPHVAFAQTAAAEPPAAQGEVDPHLPGDPEIVVTAITQSRRDILSGVSVVQGAELDQQLRPTLGETLSRQPGVSATSFGPNASRPILRGFQGDRVRILTDGIGSFDVSTTSVDHAVAIDPLLAERIEVLRGPQSLLYGSSAIGGVVNVIDRRIPRSVPDHGYHLEAIGLYGSAAEERSGEGALDVPVTRNIVLHVDGSYRRSDDLRIPGYALSDNARAQALASAALPPEPGEEPIDFAANANVRGRLPNTAGETWNVGVGASVITDTGNLGFAYSHYDSLYGVPIRFATAPGQEQEAPRLDVVQDRVDARAEVQTGGGLLQAIRARLGAATYRHFELEEDDSVGTAFYNDGLEGRLELVQAEHGAWSGVTGAQYLSRDFNSVGEEAFVPKNYTKQVGLFTLQRFYLGRVNLQLGARYEHTGLRSRPQADQDQFVAATREFDTISGSAGASYNLGGDWRVGLNLSHTERAPVGEELFADGPHAGTQAFEIGNPDFAKESSNGVEAVLRGRGAGYTFEASAYYSWFKNFIYEDQTGDIEDGLPVFQYLQADARYYGFEVQGTVTLAHVGDVSLVADALADYVHAQIEGVGPAPRIPPLRLLGGLTARGRLLDIRGEVEWVDEQDRISTFETPSDGFTLVNAEINVRPWGEDSPLALSFSANNIFDVEARRHASFLKEVAPLAGRDFRVSARVNF